MSDLVVLAFKEQKNAFETRTKLLDVQKEYLIDMEDVVVVTKEDDGKIKLHQANSLTGMYAAGGAFWGLLMGMIFFMPLFGTVLGAATGAITGHFSDIGIDDKMMKEMGDSLQPGGALLCVLMRKVEPGKVLAELEPYTAGATVMKSSLSADDEAKLTEALHAGAAKPVAS